ncbi:MAG TPA: hypothetical protein VE222_12300, partial [Nitrospiraceae bacterium]|nr:hypothetical protein [Nitrospiraceae bacterium]
MGKVNPLEPCSTPEQLFQELLASPRYRKVFQNVIDGIGRDRGALIDANDKLEDTITDLRQTLNDQEKEMVKREHVATKL